MTAFQFTDENNNAPMDVQHVVIDDSSTSSLQAHALSSRSQLTKVEFFSSSGGGQSRMTHIGDSAFRFCASLGSIYRMPPSLERIESWAFASCNHVMYIHLPDGIQSIGESTFKLCASLLTIRIPSSVRVLLFSSFRGCQSLRSIELPPTLEMIGSLAFDGCSELVNIFFTTTLTIFGEGVFRGCHKLERLVRGQEISDNAIIEGIQRRFHRLPVHELCYHQSYHISDNSSLLRKLDDAIMEQYIRCENYQDAMGMGPLHILALTATPNVNFAKTLVNQVVEESMIFEKLKGQCFRSLLCRLCCPLGSSGDGVASAADCQSLSGLWPDHFSHHPLFYACVNMAPGSPQMIQFLYEITASSELEQLGLERWRTDVLSFLGRELSGSRLDRGGNGDDSEFGNRMERVTRVNKCIKRYLLKEKLALLELATWKASIRGVPETDGKVLSPADRQDYRTVCGVDVVISNAMTFLLDQ